MVPTPNGLSMHLLMPLAAPLFRPIPRSHAAWRKWQFGRAVAAAAHSYSYRRGSRQQVWPGSCGAVSRGARPTQRPAPSGQQAEQRLFRGLLLLECLGACRQARLTLSAWIFGLHKILRTLGLFSSCYAHRTKALCFFSKLNGPGNSSNARTATDKLSQRLSIRRYRKELPYQKWLDQTCRARIGMREFFHEYPSTHS